MNEHTLDELQNQLSAAVERLSLDGDLTFKSMFGGISAYTQGRVFASLSNVGLALKLPLGAQAALLQEDGAKRLQYEEDSPPSKQYIILPNSLAADAEELSVWVKQSMEYVLSLPISKSKASKRKAREVE